MRWVVHSLSAMFHHPPPLSPISITPSPITPITPTTTPTTPSITPTTVTVERPDPSLPPFFRSTSPFRPPLSGFPAFQPRFPAHPLAMTPAPDRSTSWNLTNQYAMTGAVSDTDRNFVRFFIKIKQNSAPESPSQPLQKPIF